MNKDNRLICEAYGRVINEANTPKVVVYGFSDRGISIYRYTLLDKDTKLNKKTISHDPQFESDYNTEFYNSVQEAVRDFVNYLKQEAVINTKNAATIFGKALIENGTVVVYGIHTGSGFEASPGITLYDIPGDWNDIEVLTPDEMEGEDVHLRKDVIAHFSIKVKKDPNSSYGIPYDEVTPREDLNYSGEPVTVRTVPINGAVKALIFQLEKQVAPQIKMARSGEYNLGQMSFVKKSEDMLNRLKQGKIKSSDVFEISSIIRDMVYYNWYPEQDKDLQQLYKDLLEPTSYAYETPIPKFKRA
jgi:hypothetical protein